QFAAGLKTLNPPTATAYTAAVERGTGPWERSFAYRQADLRVLYLTRRLAALEIDRGDYRTLFGADPLTDFWREVRALPDAGLVEIPWSAVRPTPRGVFYADSIAALLAWRRVRSARHGGTFGTGERGRPPAVRSEPDPWGVNTNAAGHM